MIVAVLVLSVLVFGTIFFADEIDSGLCHIECPCGRRKMKDVLITSELEAQKIEAGLAANCPWCRAEKEAAKKGVDVHA